MKFIDPKNTISWTTQVQLGNAPEELHFCHAINTNCPSCREKGTFTIRDLQRDSLRYSLSATATCPSCQQDVFVWFVSEKNKNNRTKENCSVFIYPSPAITRDSFVRLDLVTNERIKKSYKDTLDVYNAGIWSGSLTLARRTLEGIVTDIKPEGTGSLATRLKELQLANLEKPLLELTEAVKDGGNFGAHFDPNVDPDKEMASAALDLLGYLIEYIYVLPTMVKRLKDQVAKEK